MVDPLPESIEEGADLQTGQRGAEAEVGAEAERDVMVRRAGEVEGLGVVEMGRIPIRGTVGQQHLLALADGAAVELDIFGGGTAEVVDRGDPADELFGGDLDVGPVLEELPLVGSVGEFEQGTRDDGAGGFGAAVEQQQETVGDDLVESEWVTADLAAGFGLGLDPLRHHIVDWAPGCNLVPLCLVELRARACELHGRDDASFLVIPGPTPECDRGLGPVLQFGPHGVGEAEQEADHLGGEGSGEFGHDLLLGPARARDREGVDGVADFVVPLAHGSRREPTRDEVSAGDVERIVGADDRTVGRDVGPVAALVLVGVDEDVLVLLDVDDVVVAGHHPEFVRLVPHDGLVFRSQAYLA